MNLAMLLFIVIVISSCAETKTKDEIEWDRQMARENWALCEEAYQRSGIPTYHAGHIHTRYSKAKIEHVRSDLSHNNCRRVLGSYWIN